MLENVSFGVFLNFNIYCISRSTKIAHSTQRWQNGTSTTVPPDYSMVLKCAVKEMGNYKRESKSLAWKNGNLCLNQ